MSRYEAMFATLTEKKQGAFIPFVVLGDPDVKTSMKIIETLVENGADALELGLAFSDPVADGPVIQRADMRVLAAGIKTGDAFSIIRHIRAKYANIPIGVLTYANLVMNKGVDSFYGVLQESGGDSLLIADVPTLEIAPFLDAAKQHSIDQVMIVPPNVDEERLAFIAKNSRGYVYVVTRSGVTGADSALALSSTSVFEKLKALNAAPALYGFGISTPEHVTAALSAGAAGAISGSALTALIEKQKDNDLFARVAVFTRAMKTATHH